MDYMIKKKRSVGQEVKTEIRKVVKGWGVWVDTFEIDDARITSKSLFQNLQMDYSEKIRLESERKQMETQL